MPRPQVNASRSPVSEADAVPDMDAFALPEVQVREMLQRFLASQRASSGAFALSCHSFTDAEEKEPSIKPETPRGIKRVSLLSPQNMNSNNSFVADTLLGGCD